MTTTGAWCHEMGPHLGGALADWLDTFTRANRTVYVGLVDEGVVETREALAESDGRGVLIRWGCRNRLCDCFDGEFLTVRRQYVNVPSPPPMLFAGLAHAGVLP